MLQFLLFILMILIASLLLLSFYGMEYRIAWLACCGSRLDVVSCYGAQKSQLMCTLSVLLASNDGCIVLIVLMAMCSRLVVVVVGVVVDVVVLVIAVVFVVDWLKY